MDSATRREISSIKTELQSIINELDSISIGLKTDFKNIGNDKCAQVVANVADRYRNVKKKLNNI